MKKKYITPKTQVIKINTMEIIATSQYNYNDNNDNNNNGGIGGSDEDDFFDLGAKTRFYSSYDMDF